MISKSILLGAAAAVIATGGGYYIANSGGSTCNNGCPIGAMFNSKPATSQETPKEESGGCCGMGNFSACSGEGSKASKLVNAPKPTPVDSQTLAACVGASAYATHPQSASCCADE
jgi:hypothetical protein